MTESFRVLGSSDLSCHPDKVIAVAAGDAAYFARRVVVFSRPIQRVIDRCAADRATRPLGFIDGDLLFDRDPITLLSSVAVSANLFGRTRAAIFVVAFGLRTCRARSTVFTPVRA